MVQIPENPVTQEDLNEWYKLHEQLSALKAKEALLRGKIFKGMFPNPVEGTNNVPLSEGWVLKGKHVINRSVDQAALTSLATVDAATHMSVLSSHGISADSLVRWKPELVTSEYRKLSEDQRQIFDQCLTIKEGSPALEIVLPKRAVKE